MIPDDAWDALYMLFLLFFLLGCLVAIPVITEDKE